VHFLTRYVDVLQALREPSLSATGGEPGREYHLRFRAEGLAAVAVLTAERLSALPPGSQSDLVRDVAQPWSAAVATRLFPPQGDSVRALALARDIFAAAAGPLDPALAARAGEAARELAAMFPGPLAAFHVQAFVALSQTLPCFLASAWLALLTHSEQMELLRASPGLMPGAIDELLRYAGPARAQLRRATRPVQIGGCAIGIGDYAALMLADANRDPTRFRDPDRLDLFRDAAGHLAFGAGPHACVGAPLIRAAAGAATAAFVERFSGARVEFVEWGGGFAIRGPASLRISTCP